MADLLQDFDKDDFVENSRSGQAALNPFDDDEERIEAPRIQRAIQDYPIFRREDPNFSAALSYTAEITHIVVTNGVATVATAGNILIRFPTTNPRNSETIDLKSEDKIHSMFQDPLAHHILISMDKSCECIYVGRGPKRCVPRVHTTRLKGHIESVAWNLQDQSEQTTGAILLGLSNGTIVETEVDTQEGMVGIPGLVKKKYVTEVHALSKDPTEQVEPITGIYFHPFTDSTEFKYYVVATTAKRIYQFVGVVTKGKSPVFQDLFVFYEPEKVQFMEIPSDRNSSQLQVWPQGPKATPEAFAWLTGPGVYHGTLEFRPQSRPGDSLFKSKGLLPYSSKDSSASGVLLTEYHYFLLFPDRVEAICVLNNEKVFEDKLNLKSQRDRTFLQMCSDPVYGVAYVYTKFRVFAYTPYKEGRNIWKIYLDLGKYEQALSYTQGDPENRNAVLVRQAEHYFSEKRYKDAALTYYQSQLSFEEVVLKFLQLEGNDALKTFLRKKLEDLSSKDSAQQTMLLLWLIELHLNDLKSEVKEKTRRELQAEFRQFLASPFLKDRLEENQKTIYDLLSSHGAVEDVVHFANLMKDYEKVIAHYIQQHRFEEALKSLTEKASEALQAPEGERARRFQRFSTLFYKFSPVLMQHCPQSTVQSWIKMDKYLEPKRLIPALVQCSGDPEQGPNSPYIEETQSKLATGAVVGMVSCATRYLEYCVNTLKNTDKAIHNFLISCYAKSIRSDPTSSQKLLDYLVGQSKEKTVVYDAHYALRLCLEHHLNEACVHIYSAMGLYEEALDLALEIKVDLAKKIADQPSQNKDLQKTLWLKIAKHVIEKQKDINQATKFLETCKLLRMEDILPFFSDTATIDPLRDTVCKSLTEYKNQVAELQRDMESATESARNIHSDIQVFRNQYCKLRSTDKCQLCGSRLMTSSFYMFPCHHACHKDCLIKELLQLLPAGHKDRERLQELVKEVGGAQIKEETKVKLDAILGAECVLCGDLMVDTLDKQFEAMDTTKDDSWN